MDLNPQPFKSWTNTQPFNQTGQTSCENWDSKLVHTVPTINLCNSRLKLEQYFSIFNFQTSSVKVKSELKGASFKKMILALVAHV